MKINPFGGQTITTKQEPVHDTNKPAKMAIQTIRTHIDAGVVCFRGRRYPPGTQNTRGQHQWNKNFNTQKQCYNCGENYGQNHLQSGPTKTRFVQNVPNQGTLLRFVASQTLTTWKIDMKNNRKKLKQKVLKLKSIPWNLLNLH